MLNYSGIVTIQKELATQRKTSAEVEGLISDLFNNVPQSETTLDGLLHLQAGLYKTYQLLLGNAFQGNILNPDGSFIPSTGLPKDLIPSVQATTVSQLTQTELVQNYDRRRQVLREMTAHSLRNMLWYRQLFRDLLSFYESQISNGILATPDKHRFQVTTGLAWTMLSEVFYDVSQAGGRGTYILGISDSGKVWRKALPGFNLRDMSYMDRWFRNVFELGGNAVTFYSFDPEQLNRIVGTGEFWTHTSHFEDYPSISNGFQIGSQMLTFGHSHKEFANSQPHEIINLTGQLDAITVIDESSLENPREAATFKVKHKGGAITVGRITRDQSGKFYFWPSDFPVSGWVDGAVDFGQYGGLYALVGAITRDMLVLGKEYRYGPDSPFKVKGGKPEHHSQANTLIRWIPRFRVVYPGKTGYNPEELEKRVYEVSPHHVSGHARRVHGTPDPEKVAKGRQYGIHIPNGWTFVKEFDRGAYEKAVILYKSRSAMQTLFGAI